MPRYDYICDVCDKPPLEVTHKMDHRPIVTCCGRNMRRLLSVAAIRMGPPHADYRAAGIQRGRPDEYQGIPDQHGRTCD